MIVYLADKASFREDILSNRIEEKIHAFFRARHGSSVGASEIASWRNSLSFMDRVLGDGEIPEDAGVAIEYGIPSSTKRIDFVLTGANALREKTAVIVELKQWSDAEVTGKDAVVRTFINGSKREMRFTPDLPARRARQKASLPIPLGLTTPIPVITTRGTISFLMSSGAESGGYASRSYSV